MNEVILAEYFRAQWRLLRADPYLPVIGCTEIESCIAPGTKNRLRVELDVEIARYLCDLRSFKITDIAGAGYKSGRLVLATRLLEVERACVAEQLYRETCCVEHRLRTYVEYVACT